MSAQHYACFSARYAPEVGGIESFTAHLADELLRQGDEVTIVTSAISAPAGRSVLPNGAELLRLPCNALMGGRLPLVKKDAQERELLESLRGSHVTRVLVNARFYQLSLLGLGIARELGLPAVVLDHGSAYLTLGKPAYDLALKTYEHAITKMGKRYGARYAGISSMSARWLESFGIKTDLVIPNAIDAASFRALASQRSFRLELGMVPKQALLVSVGRLSPEKGSRELVEAARILGSRVQLALAGEGALRPELEEKLPSNVTLLGNLSHPDLSALLRDADLFCLPSRSEGFCTSLLEAGAWGLLPLMTHVGGTDEVMGNPPQTGRLLDDMSVSGLVAAVEEMLEQGETGHSDVLRWHVETSCNWESTVRALEAAYE